jgi:hypothetical protein
MTHAHHSTGGVARHPPAAYTGAVRSQMNDLASLLEQTIRRYVQPGACIMDIATQPMGENERGYSGARLQRHVVTYRAPQDDTQTITLITKEAPLLERRVLDLLTSQGQCVPFSYTLDLAADRSALVCQQDLGTGPSRERASTDLDRQVARCLARIHYVNLGRATDLPWLPHADRAYFEGYILEDFREQLARAMERPAFVTEYGDLARQMEEAVGPFLAAMDSLWAEADALTLIHADMMDDHVLAHDGRAYLIDWGQARYGSLYLDLPNYFTPDNVLLYRDALAELGLDIPEEEFMGRYREAARYPGFKYIGFLLFLWMNGQLRSLHGSLLDQLLPSWSLPSAGYLHPWAVDPSCG